MSTDRMLIQTSGEIREKRCADVQSHLPHRQHSRAHRLVERRRLLPGAGRTYRAFINQHDLLIAISASGNSANILEAVKLARTQNARALASTGRAGGKLADVADFALHAPSDIIEQVEDIHLIIAHCLCVVLRDAIQARTEPVAVSVDNGNHGEIDRRVICSGVSATDN
ncbi:MAG: SIS domain-containing protein [Thermomicrobiales bacterium]